MAQLYSLPTARYAGRFLIELDPLIDWSGVADVIVASDGTGWLDYARLPVSGGTENRVISYEIADGADLPSRTLRATLHLNTENGSISSGAVDSPFNLLSGSFSPAIFGKRRVIVQEPLGALDSLDPDDWKPRFWGYIDEHPASHSGDLSIFARSAESRLMVPYTGDAVWIGTEGELLPLDESIQGVLDASFGAGTWRLKTVGGDLEWAIPAFEFEESDNVLQTVRDMAQQRGAVVRWWYDATTERFQLTLFVLQEDKVTPDFLYTPGETEDIPAHGSDVSTYRNDFTLRYVDGASGDVQTIRRTATAAERSAFGVLPLLITEGSTSHIDSADEADVMLDSIEAALRVPAVTGSRVLPKNSAIEVNTFLRFVADARIAQEDVDLYVVNWTERTAATDGGFESSTRVDLRGAPVGQIAAWLRSFGQVPERETEPDLAVWYDEVETTDESTTLQLYGGENVEDIWVYNQLIELPHTGSLIPTNAASRVAILAPGDTYEVTVPPQGHMRVVHLIGYSASGRNGDFVEFKLGPALVAEPWFEFVSARPGTGAFTSDVQLRVRDPQGLGGTLKIWSNKSGFTDPDPAALPDATLAVGSTPVTYGAADWSALDEINVHPGRGKMVYVEFVNSNGISSGQRGEYLHSWTTIVDTADALRAFSVGTTQLIDANVTQAKVALSAIGTLQLADNAVTRQKVIDKALNAIKLDDSTMTLSEFTRIVASGAVAGTRLASSTLDLTEFSRVVANSAIVAGKLSVSQLSEIATNIGIVVSGELRNAAGTHYLNLSAGAEQGFLVHPGLTLYGPGSSVTAAFSGTLTASTVVTGQIISSSNLQNGSVGYLIIADGAVRFNHIDTGAVNGTHFNASVSISVGKQIYSAGYSAGTAGWSIWGDGSAELNNIVARGTIYATAGEITGSLVTGQIRNAGNTVGIGISSVAGSWGHYVNLTGSGDLIHSEVAGDLKFKVDYAGNVYAKGEIHATSGTFAGSLSAATGTFAGSLSAATGTFAGSLSAATGTYTGDVILDSGSSAAIVFKNSGTTYANIDAASGGLLSINMVSGGVTVESVNITSAIAEFTMPVALSGGIDYGSGAKSISAGAADSGGAGFRVLRVPN